MPSVGRKVGPRGMKIDAVIAVEKRRLLSYLGRV